MFSKAIIFCSSLVLFATCKWTPVAPIYPPDSRPVITASDFGKLKVDLMDYDVVRVRHQFGLDLQCPNVTKISIGSKNTLGFIQFDSDTASYDPVARSYVIRFEFITKMDSTLLVAPLTVRYFWSESSYVDIDTSVDLIKYPYNTTEFLADTSILPPYSSYFQDVARLGNRLYFHPIAAFGLYEYDLNTKSTKMLVSYGSGDHIAADSAFVFYDLNHNSVWRYNLISNTTDLQFPLPSSTDLYGMAVYEHSLFIFTSEFSGLCYLKKYTFDGMLLDSIPYQRPAYYYLAIKDSIAYSVSYTNDPCEITRFDMRTQAFFSNVLSPVRSCGGIKAYQDKLCFSTSLKQFVGAVPFSDLKVKGT